MDEVGTTAARARERDRPRSARRIRRATIWGSCSSAREVALIEARVRELGARRPGRRIYHAGSTSAPGLYRLPASELRHISTTHEFVLVASGRGRVETPHRRFDLVPGELLVLAPGVDHVELPVAPDCPYEMFWCVLERTSVGLRVDAYTAPGWAQSTLLLGLAGRTDLESIAFVIASELCERPLGWHESVCALLRYLSCVLLRRIRNRNDAALPSDSPTVVSEPNAGRVVQAALDYCREHSHERLTVEEVAGGVGYSVSYLSHLFPTCVGQSLADYLRQLRLTNARELLETTDLSVAQISRDIGYSDPSHFTHAFTHAFQISPSAYRRRST